uniref:Protein YIF1 n=1 Tax=Schistosoma japonicum TaxID=6182 RepID=C1LJ22_SCHJA|nr:Protein YIF1A (YIP1-interacting factor homolog A) [Schistosoma japonicum]
MCAYHNTGYPPNYSEAPYYPSFQPQSQQYIPTAPQSGVSTGLSFVQNQFIPDLAARYGSAMFDEGANFVQKNVDQYINRLRLKYYFSVNNSYVAKKIGLILFPFAHTKWAINYDPAGPVPPSDDINAPDLYIPLMATITYVLLCGVIFGFQGRFSPEYLGILSSEAFGWLLLEVLLSLFAIYILNIQNNISYLDIVAYCGYKFVSMIVVLISYITLDRPGYYFGLLYVSVALAFFLIRSLKLKILPHAEAYPSECNKRRIYLLLLIALVQPLMMWWLTRRVVL